MSLRTTRVNELLRAEISELILRQVKDPRVTEGMVTLTEVRVSPDLRHATVFVSHMGSDDERKHALEGLQRAAPFMHRELVHRLKMRAVPELVFRFDPSIERGARLSDLIRKVSDEHRERPAD
ncbi:MAG: 30S ribosome-binding factor RbfA [bacterium]